MQAMSVFTGRVMYADLDKRAIWQLKDYVAEQRHDSLRLFTAHSYLGGPWRSPTSSGVTKEHLVASSRFPTVLSDPSKG